MGETSRLGAQFDEHRAHLRSVAYRVLGSAADADDAVQEAWFRLARSDTSEVANLRGWLTTVVARVSLDMLRARTARREQLDLTGDWLPGGDDPEAEAELADSVSVALLVVLESLAPAERLAFVLHDLFGVPFEEIAEIVEKSPAATRQLASRARRRVRGAAAEVPDAVDPGTPPADQRAVVEAFLAAARGGDLGRLIELLHPQATVRSDAAAVAMGLPEEVRGAAGVAEMFAGRARAARPALVDGVPGAVWSVGGVPKVAFLFTATRGRITRIELVADADRLAAAAVTWD